MEYSKLPFGRRFHGFHRRFDAEKMYREVRMRDVSDAYAEIESMGAYYRENDKDARDETLRVLDFCKKWLSQTERSVLVIMEDEI
jgi:hypothetical protein